MKMTAFKIPDFTPNQWFMIGGLVVLYVTYNKFTARDTNAGATFLDQVSNVIDTILNPIDSANSAINGWADSYVSSDNGTLLTPDFQDYVNLNGGVDNYIAQHKAGTFKGAAFMPNWTVLKPTVKPVPQKIDSFSYSNLSLAQRWKNLDLNPFN